MHSRFILVSAAVILTTAAVAFGAGEEGARPLSDADADAVLQGIFDRAAKLEYLDATMITTKQGGIVKGKQSQYAEVKMAAPAKLYMLSRGDSKEPLPFEQCSLMIFDGEYLWELEPLYEGDEKRAATRRQLNAKGEDGGAAPGMAVFLLGQDVRTPGELREKFDSVKAVFEPGKGEREGSYRFTLTLGKPDRTLDVWFRKGATVPWRIRTTETKQAHDPLGIGGGGGAKSTVDERELLQVRTNLDGLTPFPAETFVFPLTDGIEVRDDKTGDEISRESLLEYLDKLRAGLAQPKAKAP